MGLRGAQVAGWVSDDQANPVVLSLAHVLTYLQTFFGGLPIFFWDSDTKIFWFLHFLCDSLFSLR